MEYIASNTSLLITISFISFLVGIILLPVLVTLIPPDYFSHKGRQWQTTSSPHFTIRLLLTGIKNLLGLVLILAGLIMLVTPGQGVITLMVGLMIMNYPGKYKLEHWLIRRPNVLPTINWLRKKFKRPPLVIH